MIHKYFIHVFKNKKEKDWKILKHLPWLTVGSSDDVFVCDKNTAAFIFGKETQPSCLSNQNLPRPFAERRRFTTDDSPRFDQRSYAAFCEIQWGSIHDETKSNS